VQAQQHAPTVPTPATGSPRPKLSVWRRLWYGLWRILRLVLVLVLVAGLSAGTVLAGFLLKWSRELPDYRALDALKLQALTRVYARDGSLIATLAPVVGEERVDRTPVRLDQINPRAITAIIGSEDRDYFKHYGFDPVAVVRSLVETFLDSNPQGGSTITQQLVKNVLLDKPLIENDKRIVERKVKEIMVSVQVERHFVKEEILEAYLNIIFWGGNVNGIRSAARAYLGKDPINLTLIDGLYLGALLPSPNVRYNNYADYTRNGRKFSGTRSFMKLRLDRLVEDGWVTPQEAQAAWKVKLQPRGWIVRYDDAGNVLSAKRDPNVTGVNIVEELKLQDEDASNFIYEVRNFLKRKFKDRAFQEGGLKVITTLDRRMQKAALATADRSRYPVRDAQVAIVGIDPESGEVRAMVGGREIDGNRGEFNRVTQAKRQPGSSIKPLVYASAIDLGVEQWETFGNQPFRKYVPGFSSTRCPFNYWCPKNFTFSQVGPPVTMRYALNHSLNLPTVHIGERAGLSNFRERLLRMGFDVPDQLPWPSVLGSVETSPLLMAGAYASFVNGGIWIEPHFIKEIRDANNRVIWPTPDDGPLRRKIWSPQTAYIMLDMLQAVVKDPKSYSGEFATEAQIPGRSVGGKTGTTTDVRDLWFVGVTSQLVGAVWIGRDRGTLPDSLLSGEINPPIWRNFMENALTGVLPKAFVRPKGIAYRQVAGLQMAYNTRPPEASSVGSSAPSTFYSPRPPLPSVDAPPLSDEPTTVLPIDICAAEPTIADEMTPASCVEPRRVLLRLRSLYDKRP
jgi:penicillin-binding protein 1A